MARLKLTADPGLDLRKLSRAYDVRTGIGDARISESAVVAGGVELAAGHVTVDGRNVTHPRFERDTISWSQSGKDGFFSGVLHFMPDGLAFTGRTFAGITAEEMEEATLVGVVQPTVFTTQVASVGAVSDPPTPADSGGWEPGVQLTLGYTLDHNSAFPQQVIELAGQDATQYAALSVDGAKQRLVLTVVFEASIAQLGSTLSPQWPASAKVEIGWDGASFTGVLCPYDATTGAASTLEHVWEGASPTAALPRSPHANGNGALARGQVAADASTELRIEDLVTQSPIGADKIANDMLVQNVQWAIPDDWRTDFFAVAKPDLSGDPARVKLINKSLDFYQQQFGPAYLGWALNNVAGPGAPSHPLSDDEKRTLQYYLHDGVGKSKDYNVQSQGIALAAFVQACPRLGEYIADTASDWAQQAFDAITESKFFTNTMLMIVASGTMAMPNRYASILNALQPSGELSAKYYRAILTRSLTHISDQIDLSTESSVAAWLTDVLKAFITAFINAPSNPTQAQLELQAQAEALQDVANTLGSVEAVGQALTDIVVAASKGSLAATAEAAAAEFATRYPNAARAGNSMLFMFWVGGVFSSINSACNWKNLTTRAKISLVAGIVEQFGKMVEAVPDVLDAGAWASSKAMTLIEDVYTWFSGPTTVAEFDALCDAVDDSWAYTLARNVKSMFNAAKGVIETDGTLLARFFKFVPLIMKWLGAAVAAVFAAMSLWQFIDDLLNAAPTLNTSFDGVILATSMVVLGCAILEIAVDLVWIPVLGAIAAVIGAVFAIAEAFLPTPKQVTPVDKFMDGTLRPFMNKLTPPPAGWAPPTASPALVAV